jgi:hypothetical protein
MIRKYSLKLLTVLSLVFLSLSTPLPVHAQNKPDPRVVKECEAISNTYDYLTNSFIIGLPLDVPNRFEAQRDLANSNASRDIILECGAIDFKSWQSIKDDYLKVIKKANQTMKAIIRKYKLRQEITITCIKNGLKKDITSFDPKCPSGYKKLY